MKVIYKYSSYRKGFFDNPTLRITQRYTLNDPFESLPSMGQMVSFWNENLKVKLVESEENQVKFSGDFDGFGIISLTQSKDNLLMWSHYANEHRGFVLELDHKKIGLKNQVIHSSYIDDSSNGLAKPIIYTNKRHVNEVNENRKDLLFIKSEHWSYEKEYRIAAFLMQANVIKVKNEAKDTLDVLKGTDVPYFTFTDNHDDYFTLEFNHNHPSWDGIEHKKHLENVKKNFLMSACNHIAKHTDTLFLHELPKEAITKVMLGCKMDIVVRNEIISAISKYDHHIEIFEAKLHPERFELEFVPIKI